MTIDEESKIDRIGTNNSEDIISLLISDHLEWTVKDKLLMLQNKINAYLAYIESGEILKKYPQAKDCDIIIHLSSLHTPDVEGLDFLQLIKKVIVGAGFDFQWKVA